MGVQEVCIFELGQRRVVRLVLVSIFVLEAVFDTFILCFAVLQSPRMTGR